MQGRSKHCYATNNDDIRKKVIYSMVVIACSLLRSLVAYMSKAIRGVLSQKQFLVNLSNSSYCSSNFPILCKGTACALELKKTEKEQKKSSWVGFNINLIDECVCVHVCLCSHVYPALASF